jgi:hypothetical protein
MGRRRVAEHVRADLLGGQRRRAVSGFRRATLDHLANAGTGDRAPEPVQEDGLAGGAPLGQIRERSGRVLQQRAQACLAALPSQCNERMARAPAGQLQFPDRQLRRFGCPRFGVIEKQQQGALTAALRRGGAWSVEQGVELVLLQVAHRWRRGLLPRDGADPAAPFDMLRAAAGDVAGERPQMLPLQRQRSRPARRRSARR